MEKKNLCFLCGEELPNGVTTLKHHKFSKMCLNCVFAVVNEDGNYICTNDVNKNLIKNKMIEAAQQVSDGYKVQDISVEAVPLKKVTSKCKQWELDPHVLESIKSAFV